MPTLAIRASSHTGLTSPYAYQISCRIIFHLGRIFKFPEIYLKSSKKQRSWVSGKRSRSFRYKSRFASSHFVTTRSRFAANFRNPKVDSIHSLIFDTEFELENFSRTFLHSSRTMELRYITQFPSAMITTNFLVLRNR